MVNVPAPVTSSAKTALARIDALAATGAPTVDAIVDAVERADYDRAVLLALARSFAGEPLPIALTATIIPGIDADVALLALITSSVGPRSLPLVELVRRDGLSADAYGRDIAAMVLYVAWRLREGEGLREQIAWPLRRLLRRHPSPRALALLVKLVVELEDPNVTSQAEDMLPTGVLQDEAVAHLGGELDEMLARSPRDLASYIPEPEPRSRVPIGITVRTAARPGRNDPCSCGSGKKYKRCCQDREEATFSPSPVAGMSWEDFLMQAPDNLPPDALLALSLREVALLNMRAMNTRSLAVIFGHTLKARRWDLASRVLGAMEAQPDGGLRAAASFRAHLVRVLISCGEWALARQHASRVEDGLESLDTELVGLSLAGEPSDALRPLLAAAEQAVKDGESTRDVELAYALLECAPALGILVARGCLRAERQGDSEVLLEEIEHARDRLNFPTGDAAWETWSTLADGPDSEEEDVAAPASSARTRSAVQTGTAINAAAAERTDGDVSTKVNDHDRQTADEVRALQAALRESSSRTAELEQQLKRQKASVAATGSASQPADDNSAAVRRLQTKIGELKGLIDDGNDERRDLRRKLASTSRTRTNPAEQVKAATGPSEDGEDGDPVDVDIRGVLVPRLSRRFEDALRAVPAHVAAESMRTLGTLSAGDRAAWHRVKQAKDMGFALLMARVGIHHRLLFRADEGVLQVLDMVTREALDTTLKRLRAA